MKKETRKKNAYDYGMCYTASSCIQAVTLLCMRCLKAALKVL